jgi:carbonic anhydrase
VPVERRVPRSARPATRRTAAGSALLPATLSDGYRRFREGRYAQESERYRRLGEQGQKPSALVVACSDSRSGPETIFDASPGELFVVRNVAALVPAYAPDAHLHGASAALEYGVLALAIPAIVVLGHGRCGGIRAAASAAEPLSATDFVGSWVAGIGELARDVGLDRDGDDAARLRTIERRSIERSIENLRTFPWIASREADGSLSLHGAWFDISLGELHVLGPDGWIGRGDP